MEKYSIPMNKEEVIAKLKEKIESDWLFKHSLASGAVMRGTAERLGEDPDAWEIMGLIHDIDFDITADNPEQHTVLAGEWLREWGFDDRIVHAIESHNEEGGHGQRRESVLDKALSASESITGLVVTTALVMPDKKLESVKPKSVKKRMKDKAFARKVNREDILQCEELGIPIAEFCELAVKSMQKISDELGL